MIDLKIPLTHEEKRFCEYWLKYYTLMIRYLTSEHFGTHNLLKLVAYEANTRQRQKVVKLLLGRYGKLKNRQLLQETYLYMENTDNASFRENYRILSSDSSSRSRWPSNKANVL